MTKNVFEIVIGRGTLKWDAVWRMIDWLADPSEGHGLKDAFRDLLAKHCLGSEFDQVEITVEYLLGNDETGKTRHPDMAIASPSLGSPSSIALIDDLAIRSPNNSRKIDNLVLYAKMAETKFPNARKRIVVITDTTSTEKFTKLPRKFEEVKFVELVFLPLQTIGSWIDQLQVPKDHIVQDFAEWSLSL